MQRRTLNSILFVLLLVALLTCWYWAVVPMMSYGGHIYPADWTKADLIRHDWPHRIVDPGWVRTGDDFLRWMRVEAYTRMGIAGLIYLVSSGGMIWWYVRGKLYRGGDGVCRAGANPAA